MKNLETIKGTVTNITRLQSSNNGNPRFKVTIDGRIFSTKPDTMLGYSVENYYNKVVIALVGTHYKIPSVERINITTEQTS